MLKWMKITTVALLQILYALAIGGIIVALYCDELAIALLCAAAHSCLCGIWRVQELLLLADSGEDKS